MGRPRHTTQRRDNKVIAELEERIVELEAKLDSQNSKLIRQRVQGEMHVAELEQQLILRDSDVELLNAVKQDLLKQVASLQERIEMLESQLEVH